MNEHITLLPTVRIHRVRFFECDVWEGDYPRDNVRTEDFDFDRDEDLIERAARLIESEGLTFEASGNEWAANPDGTTIIDYGAGQREETSAHLIGFTDDETIALIERVG